MIGSMNTREKILDTASRLLETRAYHGFSFQDIADEVGIRKPSLYHHFASKDEIAIEILNSSKDTFIAELLKLEDETPSKQLERYLAMFRMLQAGGQRMCPGGSFAAIWDAVSPEVQSEVRKFVNFHLEWLEKNLQAGKNLDEYYFTCSPKIQAQYITTCLQGAMLTARLTANSRLFDNVVDKMKTSFIVEYQN